MGYWKPSLYGTKTWIRTSSAALGVLTFVVLTSSQASAAGCRDLYHTSIRDKLESLQDHQWQGFAPDFRLEFYMQTLVTMIEKGLLTVDDVVRGNIFTAHAVKGNEAFLFFETLDGNFLFMTIGNKYPARYLGVSRPYGEVHEINSKQHGDVFALSYKGEGEKTELEITVVRSGDGVRYDKSEPPADFSGRPWILPGQDPPGQD